MKQVCVYCGSNPGVLPQYRQAAEALGSALAVQQIGLVYGGYGEGLMGVVSGAVLAKGGSVCGVTPRGLFGDGKPHAPNVQLIEVENMHTRKQKMMQLADAFIALPGGVGTYEELFETFSWAQLGLHQKPIGLLNTAGFFDPLLAMLQHTAEQGFMGRQALGRLLVCDEPGLLLQQLAVAVPAAAAPGEIHQRG